MHNQGKEKLQTRAEMWLGSWGRALGWAEEADITENREREGDCERAG